MFTKGDYVVYGSTGICEVLDVTTMDLSGVPEDKVYYILHPYKKKGSEIFTPVENKRTIMRNLILKKDAEELLKNISNIETFKIPNEKFREERYKECVRGCDCLEMMMLVKTLLQRKRERLTQGKNFPATDEKYLRIAEENLYSELAMSLNMEKEAIRDRVSSEVSICQLVC